MAFCLALSLKNNNSCLWPTNYACLGKLQDHPNVYFSVHVPKLWTDINHTCFHKSNVQSIQHFFENLRISTLIHSKCKPQTEGTYMQWLQPVKVLNIHNILLYELSVGGMDASYTAVTTYYIAVLNHPTTTKLLIEQSERAVITVLYDIELYSPFHSNNTRLSCSRLQIS